VASPAPRGTGFITIFGDAAGVEYLLNKVSVSLSPIGMAAFMGGSVDAYLHNRARDRFQNEGDDAVGKWLPLAAATQEIRASQGYGPDHPINVRTHELENYIVGSPSEITVTPVGATLTLPGKEPAGRLQKKVRTAQAGTDIPLTPPRPVLGMNETDLIFVMDALSAHIALGVAP
jgi:hypothetical protein